MIRPTLTAFALVGAMALAGASGARAQARPETSPATSVAPLTVTAPRPGGVADAAVEVPADDSTGRHWASVWPAAALRDGVGGHVLLSCEVDRHGVATWCRVLGETPPGQGFGAAAMALRPTFRLKPAEGPGGPAQTTMTVAVEFTPPKAAVAWGGGRGGGANAASTGPLSSGGGADAPSISGPTPDHRSVSMLNDPVWASTVGWDDLVRAVPTRAAGLSGFVVVHCQVRPGGAVWRCHVIREDPEDRGFAGAALRLAERFRVAPEWSTAPHHGELWVDIPIRFPDPGVAASRLVGRPYWVSGFDPGQAVKIFPREAAEKGLSTGLGVAECSVTRDGALARCAPKSADPEGLGFSEAAVELASTMRMNPWLRDGQPADGAVVRVAVRLNLKPAGPPS